MAKQSAEGIWRAMTDVATSMIQPPKKSLCFVEGQIVAKSMSKKEWLQGIFSKHDLKKIQKILHERESELIKIANEKQDRGASVQSQQDVINQLAIQTKSTKVAINFYKDRYNNWMSNLPDRVKEKSLLDIVLPGTHDSGAYRIDFEHSHGQKKIQFLGFVANVLPFVGSVLRGAAQTQSMDIYEQLSHGIRSLDFRISYNPAQQKFYLSHMFACVPIEEALDDIKRFLQEHPGEIIQIHAKPDKKNANNMKGKHDDLIQLIDAKLPSMLIENHTNNASNKESIHSQLQIKSLLAQNKRVMFCYSESMPNHRQVWPKLLDTHWPNAQNQKQQIQANMRVVRHKTLDQKRVHGIGFNVTSNAIEILKHVFERVHRSRVKRKHCLRAYARDINRHVPHFVYKHRKQIKEKINVITLDYPERCDAVEAIVRLNHEGVERFVQEIKHINKQS